MNSKCLLQLNVLSCILILISMDISAQMNADFFPLFRADTNNPIIRYGDGFPDATWNDPTVLKENDQYIMYLSASEGISEENIVKIYRKVSTDGYSWSLSPNFPVIEPLAGTYYGGSTETPSIVYKDSIYHMYLTVYPGQNIPDEFVIAHATSYDGISWSMDSLPVLESDGSASWKGFVVGEPGAMVYNDSIYLFFTAAGLQNSKSIQCIGLMKSADGVNFGAAEQAVLLPEDVYPPSDEYLGLSTPSALLIQDSIYLFTDVAKNVNGVWTQVALHQFKTDGKSGLWYYDDEPIHRMQDFEWTDGSFYSELRSITALMDDDGFLRIWYAGNRLADVVGNDTIYHATMDSLGKLHVDPYYWGIGTSEYQFINTIGISSKTKVKVDFKIYPNPFSTQTIIKTDKVLRAASYALFNVYGQQVSPLKKLLGDNEILFRENLPSGLYFLRVFQENVILTESKLLIID